MVVSVLVFIIASLAGLLLLGFLFHKRKLAQAFETAQAKSQRVIEQTHRDADRVIKTAIQESKEESLKRRRAFEEEIRKKKSELHTQEQKYREKETEIKEIQDELSSKEKKLRDLEQKLIDDEKGALRLKAEYELSIEKNQRPLKR